ncbi:RNA polymerase sigma-70 factor (ECF subfamily) [Micromonospora sp. Llam0]|uniref:sigma-70 family RNA polymerase sigma factor n=1 Tax=Micromonospora sp. Llam0 TaxID=2485143 RepID=UPI000F4778C5|nr:sigma-70 family RNA polymerase sigma factor [Micromonospora sp. Llam0]ROO63185.1 RNA polymerase sigma-70 factor (ECF subfamily) [Micromonospora sp. Llam0]
METLECDPQPTQADLVTWYERVLVPQSRPALHRYARRLVPGDPHRAEDLVQETLLRAWRNLASVASSRSPQAWLSRVAHNLSIDQARRVAARPAEVAEDVTGTVWQPAESLYDAALDWATLEPALRSLSAVHREALVLVYYQDRTHREVATLLGVPPGTVKSRTHNATRELQRVLSSHGVTGSAVY